MALQDDAWCWSCYWNAARHHDVQLWRSIQLSSAFRSDEAEAKIAKRQGVRKGQSMVYIALIPVLIRG